ncbi:Uncharacterised protein [Mycobacteroides abscessus subsp. massiliense]|nr:Uncharacterised protein [Mycobacteroides abscessus subsp. massiliense]
MALSKTSPMLPWLVFMLAVSVAGSVGIFPVRGICFSMVLEALPAGRYWQLAPTSADGTNLGSAGPARGGSSGVGNDDVGGASTVDTGVVDAVS